MATVYIEEFSEIGSDIPGDGKGRAPAQCGRQPSGAQQTLPIGTATASTSFMGTTRMVRLHTDGVISYAFGAAPTATTSFPRMAADTTEYFAVKPGHKVSVISNT